MDRKIVERAMSRHEPLSREQERELGVRARNGDLQARDELVLANLRFAVKMARRHRGQGVDDDDLVQQASFALVLAANKFDPEKGVKFISYAVWWIRQAIGRATAAQAGPVCLHEQRAAEAQRITRERDRLRKELGREPTPPELAGAAGVTLKTLRALETAMAPPVPLDAPAARPRDGTRCHEVPADTPGPDLVVEENQRTEALHQAMQTLPERDRRLLRDHFGLEGEPRPLARIAREEGRSREALRQRKARALCRLRTQLDGREL